MYIHVKIIGSVLIALAFMHVFFPRYFKWKKELKELSLINRQMMMVHTFFIALLLLLLGLLCISSTDELLQTNLGRKINLGMGIFWVTRLYFQFFVYSKQLWLHKKLETSIHILFAVLWFYFSCVFLYLGIEGVFF
jgi:hypothetical protein